MNRGKGVASVSPFTLSRQRGEYGELSIFDWGMGIVDCQLVIGGLRHDGLSIVDWGGTPRGAHAFGMARPDAANTG
jgi:hypothetical protein